MSTENDERAQLIDQHLEASRRSSTVTVLLHAKIAEHLGLGPNDHKALDVIIRAGKVTAGQLAEITGLTSGAVTGVIDRLENAGLARRVRDKTDRRKVFVQPAESFREEFGTVFISIQESVQSLLDRYSNEELALLNDYLDRCITMMENQMKKL